MGFVSAEDVRRVGIVGAGLIGFSWAHVFSRCGLEVRLFDPDAEALQRAESRLRAAFDLFVRERLMTADGAKESMGRVHFCQQMTDAVREADYVQECVPEDLELKRRVLAEIDSLAGTDSLIASSAAQLPISDISSAMLHPERCALAHPTNPPHLLPLVEVAAGRLTDPEVLQNLRSFMERVGQKPITVRKEVYGYVLNRIQYALVREAFHLLREGVATVGDIDRCVTEGLGLRWAFTGPFMVEELNAQDIEDGLRKDVDENEELWAALGDFHRTEETDIRRAAEGVRELLGVRSHDSVVQWRDEMVVRLLRLKQQGSSSREGGEPV